MEEEKEIEVEDYVSEILDLVRSGINDDELSEKLNDYHENDIARAFEQLTPAERVHLYKLIDPDKMSEIFSYIEDIDDYVKELDDHYMAEILENMDSDDAVDLLEDMDEDTQKKLTELMDEDSKEDIELIQSYDDDEVGSVMTTNFIVIEKNLTIKAAMKSMVEQAKENDNIGTIYVNDEKGKFYGAIDLKDLIIARDYVDLNDLIVTSYPYVNDHEKISDCIERIKDYSEDSIPVLDDNDVILGVITAQDVVEVVDDEMGDDYAKLAGLTAEEDLEEPLLTSMKKRMPWLIALLFLGMLVSTVVGMFESVVASIAIIVCFQSLILDMAGNVGTQSLAVTIRVLMDENLTGAQKLKLVFKECRVGLCNGIILGIFAFIFVGLYVWIIKGNPVHYSFLISFCVGASLALAMLISSLVGTVIPMFFHKLGVDPAVASGPLITTVNDLVAVISYYGLAWLLLIEIFKLV